jgi:predicted AAA+ superfamily ATPase
MSDNAVTAWLTMVICIRAKRLKRKSLYLNALVLWISFYPFGQDDYRHRCVLVAQLLAVMRRRLRMPAPKALRWALQSGSRSGRVAWQFAKDYAGQWKERDHV